MNCSSKVLDFFLDIVFPPKCFKCGFSLIGLESSSICSSCLRQIALIKQPFCDACGKPFYFQYDLPFEGDYWCGTCRTEKHYFDKARSLGKYEGVFKEALISYKYKGRRELLKDFIKICLQSQNNCYFIPLKKDVDKTEGIDLILYVPLHKKKLQTRGFDQAFLIAKAISKLSNIPLKADFLFKKKETPPQAALKKQIRIKNLKGAFDVRDSSFLEGKNVLLVDDVITTGVTVNECSKVLKQHGTNRVEVFTLARAV
ncbi:MAG: ComF family protein [Nitrospinota bacterium]